MKGIGSAAEDDVIALLQERDQFTKQAACQVLKDIGTKKSEPALEPLSKERSPIVKRAAQEALAAINARNK